MRALVLGATGHIGAHVTRALVAKGYDIRAAYRNPAYRFVLDGVPVAPIQLDVEEASQLRAAAEGCDVVFHCAGFYPRFMDRRAQAIERGVTQVVRVFDVLRPSGAKRIVYTSSAATMASVPHRLSTEADAEPWPPPTTPRAGRPDRTLYATVKIAMERAVLRYAHEGLPVVVVNPSVCLGEYDARPFSGRLVLLFAKGRLPVYLEHQFNAVYTGDVGQAHVAAAEAGRPGERYLLTAHQLTISEFARLVASEAGVRPPRWRLPSPLVMAVSALSEVTAAVTRTEPLIPRSAIQHARFPQRLDGSKARQELGMPQTPLQEAIRRALGWFRQQGYL